MTNVMDLIRLYWPTVLVFGAVVTIAIAGTAIGGSRLPELSFRSLLFAAVYVGLYCLVLVEVRYLWPAVMVLLLGALAVVNSWESARRWLPVMVALPLSAILVLGPYWRPSVGLGNENLELLFEPQATRRVLGAQARDDAEALRPVAAHTRIASNAQREKSSYLAYFVDGSYYGATVDEPAHVTKARLEELEIEIFLIWGDSDLATPDYLDGYTLIETLENGDLRVYKQTALVGARVDAVRINSMS